jgi:hypothetical protein
VTVTIGGTNEAGNPSPVYNAANGHWYQVVSTSGMTWTQAKAYAETLSFNGTKGYLATITSGAEQAFINSAFGSSTHYAWLGGSDAASEGTWKWMTGPEAGKTFYVGQWPSGTAVGYANFSSSNPDNYSGYVATGQDYLMSWSTMGWDDEGGTSSSQFLLVEYGGFNAPTDDILVGTSAADVFTFHNNAFGKDVVYGFDKAADDLRFASSVFANAAAALASATQVGDNVVFTVDGANTVTLANILLADLSAANIEIF